MYLITTWFGVFLCDDKRVKHSVLFPQDEDEIYERLMSVSQGEVLSEEKEIAKRIDKGVIIVHDPRLSGIGMYKPFDPLFREIIIRPEDYNISSNLLNRVSLRLANEFVRTQLESKDLQIIQMVKAYDELLEVS
ncbi:MAG: hypothetical protein QXS02_05890, partial [Candidatus Thermoplasmatota archaeon]